MTESPRTADQPAKPVQASPKSVFEREFPPSRETGWRGHWYRLIYHHDPPQERNFDMVLIIAVMARVVVVLVRTARARTGRLASSPLRYGVARRVLN